MTKTEIKQNIHTLVDKFDNDDTLIHIEEMLESLSDESKSFSNLSDGEKSSINKGLEQLSKGEKIDYEDIKKNYPEWLRK